MNLPPAIFLMGPTASGKTSLAIQLFETLPSSIISVDSALIYRDMNIGTAKPDAITLKHAPHRLIDIRNPDESYSAAQFREDALREMHEISQRGKIPLLVGGTMLYYKALREGLSSLPEADPILRQQLDIEASEKGWPALHEKLARLDPVTAARLKPADSQRIQRALEVCLITGKPMSSLQQAEKPKLPYNVITISLEPSDRSILHKRIEQRFDQMLENGIVDEVKQLKANFSLTVDMPSMRCVGYRQAWQHIEGEIDANDLREKGIAATRQLAKRQLTWLRAMHDVNRFDCLKENIYADVKDLINKQI